MARSAVSLVGPARRIDAAASTAHETYSAAVTRRSDTTLAEQLAQRYAERQALGLIETRRQRGFFVRVGKDASPREAGREPPRGGAALPMPNSATALMRGMLQAPGERPMPGFGTLPAAWLDAALLTAAVRRVTYAHLAPAHAPRLAALDALERTIYISGFAKRS